MNERRGALDKTHIAAAAAISWAALRPHHDRAVCVRARGGLFADRTAGGIVLGTMMGRERHHLLLLLALAGFLSAACRPTSTSEGRYIVTAEAINIGVGSGRFCIATDPTDPHGAWWWERGPKACSSRSTGPAVFHAENAAVR